MVFMEINETKGILLDHYARYPIMEIPDMVKLLYQSEWAGGHMIADRSESLTRLEKECLKLTVSPGREAFEDISNGLCRLYLDSPKRRDLSLPTLNRFFVNTANGNAGTVQGFESKLEILRQCCASGKLPYSVEELDRYLSDYREQGDPPVRHTRAYRDAYHPAYRVVDGAYRDYFAVFSWIDSLLAQKDRVCIAIDGNCGAGKSTLAALIAGVYESNVFHMDDYFLPPDLRTGERLNEIGGNVDYERFRREIIEGLKRGGAFSYRPYNCGTQTLEPPVRISPRPVNIIEGSYSMHPALRDLYDLTVFLSVDAKEQSRRILARNGEAMYRRFMEEWVPMENRYFDGMGIRERCDLVYDDGKFV